MNNITTLGDEHTIVCVSFGPVLGFLQVADSFSLPKDRAMFLAFFRITEEGNYVVEFLSSSSSNGEI